MPEPASIPQLLGLCTANFQVSLRPLGIDFGKLTAAAMQSTGAAIEDIFASFAQCGVSDSDHSDSEKHATALPSSSHASRHAVPASGGGCTSITLAETAQI